LTGIRALIYCPRTRRSKGATAAHPVAQDTLANDSRTYHREGEGESVCCTLTSTFRPGGGGDEVTPLVMAEGFGPGWTPEEACRLALQALRNRFVQAEDENAVHVLMDALAIANQVVHDRESAYGADGEIGVWLPAAILSGSFLCLASVGRGSAFVVSRDKATYRLSPDLDLGPDTYLGCRPALSWPQVNDIGRPFIGPGVRVDQRDLIVLLNGAAGDGLDASQLPGSLGHMEIDQAANRLLRLGQTRPRCSSHAGGRPNLSAVGVLVAQLGGAASEASLMAWWRWAILVILSALLLATASTGFWMWHTVRPDRARSVTPMSISSPTVLLWLPTLIPSMTALPSPWPVATRATSDIPTANRPQMPAAAPSAASGATSTIRPMSGNGPETTVPGDSFPTPTVPAGPIQVGGRVIVAGTEGLGISLRDRPGTAGMRLAVLLDGELMDVLGGPEQANDIAWWQLRTSTGLEGWAVEQYLQGVANWSGVEP